MSIWTPQTIEVRVSIKGRKSMRSAYVSKDGLFAYYETYGFGYPEFGYTVCHVPTQYALSRGHSNRRNAELFAAIWRALPIPWEKDTRAIRLASKKMPAQLKAWVRSVLSQVEGK